MEMTGNYITLSRNTIFKSRYGKWYLIDTRKGGEEKLLVEEDTKDVLYFLFQGRSIQETIKEFDFSCTELYDFFKELVQNGVIEFSDSPMDSTGKCYDINPPLDNLNILITNECNLNCIHCCFDSGKIIEGELNGISWIDIIRQAQHLGVFQLNISGGEPLLHKDFLRIAKYVASIPTLCVSLNTNGTINIDGYETLFASAFSGIQVSIDSIIAEKHDAFRNSKGCLKKSIRTIEQLVNSGIETKVGFLLNSRNLSALDGVIEFCEQVGVTALNVGFVNFVGRAKINTLVYPITPQSLQGEHLLVYPITPQSLQGEHLLERMYDKFREIIKRNTKLKIALPFYPYLDDNLSYQNKRFICGGDENQFISVMANGEVLPCDILPVDSFTCGNIKNIPLREIWVSEKMRAFKQMNPRHLLNCQKCSYFQFCGGPCLARAFHSTNSLEGVDEIKCIIAKFLAKKSGMDK